ncbi:response regulator transcription factor [Psychromonas sp. KJ10-10]|uniref:response regulator transcription factor n=1 Tax=Psychromonas sp. KJ10-10 TaxID=3391823 RepID=UPI0039B5C4C5
MKQTVLVIDDKINVQIMLTDVLTTHGYQVICASNGKEGLHKLTKHKPDIILLDVMMPQMDGYEFIKKLRQTSELPVIMITAKQQEADIVKGFELGADDYIAKPFRMNEMLMRLKAVLKRTAGNAIPQTLLRVASLTLNTENKELTINGKLIELTVAELTLLYLLMQNAEHTVTKATFCTQLINEGYSGLESTLKIHIRNIRIKLEPLIEGQLSIESIFGIGYRLRLTS